MQRKAGVLYRTRTFLLAALCTIGVGGDGEAIGRGGEKDNYGCMDRAVAVNGAKNER